MVLPFNEISEFLHDSGMWEILDRGIRNPGLWNSELSQSKSHYGSWLEESRNMLAIGMWNPSSTDKQSGIHSAESRIQDCPE